MAKIIQFIYEFYQRNLLERLVIYTFLATFIVAIIFEFALGQWSFIQSQNKQWIFYGLLALEYIINIHKLIHLRVRVNPISLYACIFLIMCAHGLFMGIALNNNFFNLINDFIPPFMIALNILRMQSHTESQEINIPRLLKECTFFAFATCCILFAGKMIGLPSIPKLGVTTLYLPLFFAGLFYYKPFPKWIFICAMIMIVISLDNFNRTTLAFAGIGIGIFMLFTMLKNPGKGIISVVAGLSIIALFALSIAEDSPTYKRIIGIGNISADARTGSVGERNSEWIAIKTKLKQEGETVHWLGLGFGGVYEVAFTHEYLKDYGHAHYAWAWFNLRFGKIGYLYFVLMIMALTYNIMRFATHRDAVSCFIALLCCYCLLYAMTYVNAIFMLSGINFLYRKK